MKRAKIDGEALKAVEVVSDIEFPFRMTARRCVLIWDQFMYTRYQKQFICLHSSISYFASHQNGISAPNLALKKAAG